MFQLLVIAIVIALVVLIVRSNRLARLNWQQKVNLPGVWVLAEGDDRLRLSGLVSHGSYERTSEGRIEIGRWQLRGNRLLMQSRMGEEHSFDFVFFDVGKIGLQQIGFKPAIYIKDSSNVVSLKQR